MAKKNLAMLGLAGFATALFGAGLLGGNANAQEFITGSYTLGSESPVTDGIVVNEGQEVTINLGGTTVSNTTGRSVIINKGKLTITGEGTVSTVNAKTAAVTNYPGAVLTLNGGTYMSSKWYTIRNYGEIELNDGVVVKSDGANAGNASMVTNGWAGATDVNNGDKIVAADRKSDPKMTINGGTYTAGLTNCSVIKNDDYSNLTINGGIFKQPEGSLPECDSVILNWNNANINNGEFYSENGPVLSNGAYQGTADKGLLNVNGGTFKIGENGTVFGYGLGGDGIGEVVLANGEFAEAPRVQKANNFLILGGIYGTEPVAEMIKAGYKAVDQGDGTYVIVLNAPAVSDETENKDAAGNEALLNGFAVNILQNVINAGTLTDGMVIGGANDTKFVVTNAGLLANALSGSMELKLESTAVAAGNDEQALIDAELPENAKALGAYEVAVVLRDAAGNELGRATELSEKLKVAFNVANVDPVAEGYKRTWKVIRIHDGEVTTLDATYDEATAQVMTESDLYSLFVPYFIDIMNSIGGGETEDPNLPSTPNTGLFTDRDGKGTDATAVIVTLTAAVTALALAVYAIKTTRR